MEKKETAATVLKEFASSTTAHGVGHMVSARNWVLKIIWLLLMIGAITMIVIQVTLLYNKYISYPTNTKVELVNERLYFPSVTICNHNTVKLEAVTESPAIRDFLLSLDEYFGGNWVSTDPELKDDWRRRRKKRGTDEDEDEDEDDKFVDGGSDGTSTDGDGKDATKFGFQGFFKDADTDNLTESEFFFDLSSDQYQGYDPLFKSEEEFKLRLAKLTDEELVQYVQPLDVFIVKCTFGGKECFAEDFEPVRDFDYGMCYTFPNRTKYPHGLKSSVAGPLHGLHLILNIQQRDYVPYVSPSAGVRVNVHQFKSDPYPYESGFSVEPGKESSVSLKVEYISRLGKPHGTCDKSERFPSFLACMRACLEALIEEDCLCSRQSSATMEESMNRIVPVCQYINELECVEATIQRMSNETGLCGDCNKPCKETAYRQVISSASWPSDVYEEVLREEINALTTGWDAGYRNWLSSPEETERNILKLNVYYGELYYQKITEEPAYEIEQFASDIGGQLGLWAGISVLSLAECMELILVLAEVIMRRLGGERKRTVTIEGSSSGSPNKPDNTTDLTSVDF